MIKHFLRNLIFVLCICLTGCGANSVDFQGATSKNAVVSPETESRFLPFIESSDSLPNQVWVNMELEDNVTVSDEILQSNLGELLYAEKDEIIHILNNEIPLLDEYWTDNVVLGTPWIRLALMDITNDGVPECWHCKVKMKNQLTES